MKTQKGFTLIELIVVIVILGILGAIALPKFVDVAGDARASVMKGVGGSMAAANAMVYAKAQIANPAAATVVVNGFTINLTNGYATQISGANGLANLLDLQPATDFTLAATTVTHAKAKTPATCVITYVAATATVPPTYTPSVAGC